MPIYDPALRGFGDLASALMLAPQIARSNRIADEERSYRKTRDEDALSQALQIHQDTIAAREQDRAERKADRDAAQREQTRQFNAEEGRKTLSDLGSGALHVAKLLKPNDRKRNTQLVSNPGEPPYLVDTETGEILPVIGAPNVPIKAPPRGSNWQIHSDPTTKQLVRVNPDTGEVVPIVTPEPPAPAWAGKPTTGPEGKPFAGPELRSALGWRATPLAPFLGNESYAGLPSASEFNASQDAALANPMYTPPAASVKQALAAPQPADDLTGLSPQSVASFQRVLAEGDPAKIAKARQRLADLRAQGK